MRGAIVKLYLALLSLVYAGFAAAGYVAPASFASRIDVTLGSSTAIADFSAAYGGLSAAFTVAFVLGLMRPHTWERPALLMGGVSCAGLLLGRVLAVAQHGPAGPYINASMALEALSVGIAVALLRA